MEVGREAQEVWDFLDRNFNETRVDRESAIRGIVKHCRTVYPKKNVMVCHSPHLANLEGCVKRHMELRTGLLGTTGVDVYIFDHGTFTNLGDGGYKNWCFEGNFHRDGNHVQFRRID
jgi:hypothetical protein